MMLPIVIDNIATTTITVCDVDGRFPVIADANLKKVAIAVTFAKVLIVAVVSDGEPS